MADAVTSLGELEQQDDSFIRTPHRTRATTEVAAMLEAIWRMESLEMR